MTEDSQEQILISTVTPVYSGADYLPRLVLALDSLRQSWETEGCPLKLLESIFVVDAAIDDSLCVLEKLAEDHSWVKVINLSKNFGQHPATIAGILHSSGHWIVTLDEDLQHEPKHIQKMLQRAVEDSSDIVYAKPSEKVHQNLFRDISSSAYKRILSLMTGNKNIENFNSFRVIRGDVARGAASICGHETYFDIALSWFSNRCVTENLLLKDERYISEGKSGYNLYKLLSHSRRLVLSSQTKALRLGLFVGVGALSVSAIFTVRVIIMKLMFSDIIDVKGWTSLFLGILFFGGLSVFLIGVLLEFMSILLLNAQGKPTFFAIDRSFDRSLKDFFCSRV